MDDAAFGLTESERVFFTAGIRHILHVQSVNVSREKEAQQKLLPHYLESYLLKTAQGAKTLWTYAGLTDDLSGNTNPDRARIIKELVSFLKLSKGSICFWPGHPVSGQQFDYSFFAFGVDKLKPRSIVVFDRNIVSTGTQLFVDSTSFEQRIGIPVVWLDSLEVLLTDNIQKNSVLASLNAHFDSLA